MVALLSRRLGVQHLSLIEDAVQSALMIALETWTTKDPPDNPSAWIYRVAKNNILGVFRRESKYSTLLQGNDNDAVPDLSVTAEYFLSHEIQDDLLLMLFTCCDDVIPLESQLVLALKTLCGFDVREISLRLFTSEANIYKRLTRARTCLKERGVRVRSLSTDDYVSRSSAVHKILYLLFTEGYLSSSIDSALRCELCDEAIRLTIILSENRLTSTPEGYALLALMYLHRARMDARISGNGGLLLLEQQDRNLWDRNQIQQGMECLEKSATGNTISRYHAEAGIAVEHCLAESFEQTHWESIDEYYGLLEQISPSPVNVLNRAIVLAEWKCPEDGLNLLESFEAPLWLCSSHLWHAVHSDLNNRCGNLDKAELHRVQALDLAPNVAVKTMLEQRLSPP